MLPHTPRPPGAPGTRSRLLHALMPGSPAVDAGYAFDCTDLYAATLAFDQRGQYRHADGNLDGAFRCDMGAYEFGETVFVPLVVR